MKSIEKKMRIQLFDPEFNMLSDRLLAQDTEMYKGPGEVHNGPLKVEFCLFDQEDVDGCLEYLQKIKGDLPIETRVKKVKVQTESGTDADRQRISTLIVAAETQEEAIRILRQEGFIFLTAQDIEDYQVCTLDKKEHKYEWMIRLLKEAKDPANNKYDPTKMYGFKIIGEKLDTFAVKAFGESGEQTKPWKSQKEFNFKKVNLTKFHPAMIEEERLRFSKELAKLRKDPEAEASKFFKRWAPFSDFQEKEDWATRLQ